MYLFHWMEKTVTSANKHSTWGSKVKVTSLQTGTLDNFEYSFQSSSINLSSTSEPKLHSQVTPMLMNIKRTISKDFSTVSWTIEEGIVYNISKMKHKTK